MKAAVKKRRRIDSPRVDRISPDAAKERLGRVAQFLEDQAGPFDDDATEAACAIRDFLAGRAPSLDAAFGFVRPRGAPRSMEAEHLNRAKLILNHVKGIRRGNVLVDWPAVLSKFPDLDERELRRVWNAYGVRAFALAFEKDSGGEIRSN